MTVATSFARRAFGSNDAVPTFHAIMAGMHRIDVIVFPGFQLLDAAGPGATAPVPFTLVGTQAFPTGGQVRRAGVFGASFFEHDGGNVRRVALYMRTLGIDGLWPVWLGNRPDLLPAARSMPTWPAPGSVRRVNGVVIVKIGPPTPQQLNPG